MVIKTPQLAKMLRFPKGSRNAIKEKITLKKKLFFSNGEVRMIVL